MITEDYVSEKTSELLKEKGFNEECWCLYHLVTHKFAREVNFDLRYNNELPNYIASAPTLQMAMKWLKTIHNLYIVIPPSSDCRFVYEIYKIHSNYPTELKLSSESEEFFNKPEEATEFAIKYCLEKLI